MSQDQIDRIMDRLEKIEGHLASNCRECVVDLAVGKEKMTGMDTRITEIRVMFWAILILIAGQYIVKFMAA